MNFIVILFSKDQERSTNMVTDSFNTLTETTQQIGNHKQLLQIFWVFVFNEIERPSFLIKMFIQVRKSNRSGIFIGIAHLEVVHVEWRRRQIGERLGLLWSSWGRSFFSLLGLFFGLFFFGLFLFLWSRGNSLLLTKTSFTNHRHKEGLVHTGQKPSVCVLESFSESRIQQRAVTRKKRSGKNNICETQTITNKESLVGQVSIKSHQNFTNISDGLLSRIRVVWDLSLDSVQPQLEGDINIIGSKVDPTVNQTHFKVIGSTKLSRITI
mmetsp:Transcript_25195/g.34834  ORF Transcript_25195/g.34834 Transcript_25195/m.34834 type:complete len:268 (-) Transcript_25195:323-1126(-)